MDSFTGCKVKENSPTQTELKQKDNKSFIKCTGVNKSDENKSFLKYIKGNESDPSLLKKIKRSYQCAPRECDKYTFEKGKKYFKECIEGNKSDPLLEGLKRAYQCTPKDEFTPSIIELSKCYQEQYKRNKSEVKDMMLIYAKKRIIANKCVSDNFDKITIQQYDKLYNSIIDTAEKMYTLLYEI